ncbi:MAG: CAAX prenyl protease-related protein [Methylophilaceae bacterium]
MTMLKSPAFARIAPFAVYILFLAVDGTLASLVTKLGGDARLLYALRVSVVAALLVWFWRGYSELAWPVKMPLGNWMWSVLAGVAVFALWILPYPAWATLGTVGAGFNPIQPDGSINFLLAGIRVAGAALVVPLMEELFFRSYLMRWVDRINFLEIDPAKTTHYAFLITALLFSIEHHLWLAGLLAGLVYGALYKLTRNLWSPVLAHSVTNGMLGFWVLHTGEWKYW